MALFNRSTVGWNTAVQRIADTIGASADTEMLGRAHTSLRAAFQFLGGKFRWDFMRAENPPVRIVGAYGVTGVSASSGQVSAAMPTNHGFETDDVVSGTGFMLGTRVTATGANSIGLTTAYSAAAGIQVVSVTAIRDMYSAPSDMRTLYSVRLLGDSRALRYSGRRFIDRTISDEFTLGTPEAYDLFRLGEKSKIRLIPAPGGSDTLMLRYFRRFTLASASSVTSVLEIPEDYEEIPISWAKWHFLTDKGEGRKQQGQTWLSLAQDGLKMMISEQSSLADEDLTIIPGHVAGWPSVNDTRQGAIYYDYS